MDPITLIASGFSALFGAGLVAGVHKQKVSRIERDLDALVEMPVRLARLEGKLDTLIQIEKMKMATQSQIPKHL